MFWRKWIKYQFILQIVVEERFIVMQYKYIIFIYIIYILYTDILLETSWFISLIVVYSKFIKSKKIYYTLKWPFYE